MRSRSGGETIQLVSLIVFVALIVYIISSLLGSVLNNLKTTTAINFTVEDVAEVSGYILRTEAPLYGRGYTVSVGEGDKVSVGENIAVRYEGEGSASLASEINAVKSAIRLREDSENARKTDAERQAESVLHLSRAVAHGDIQDIISAADSVRTFIMEESPEGSSSLAALYDRLAALEQRAESVTSYLKASSSGIFSLVTDGYESVTVSDIESLSPAELKEKFNGVVAPDGTVGKLISGLTWYYAAVTDSSDAEKFSVGDEVDVDFTQSFGRTVSMDVERIGDADAEGKCVVLFSSNQFIADTASLRTATGRIRFSSVSGILLPKKAIHYNDKGEAHVYIMVGIQMREVGIEILSELSEDMVIAVQNDGNTDYYLREGTEIIVKGKNLYDKKVVED